jgi:DNA gyrase subunit A
LIERIATIIREGGLEGITDLRDESDRRAMRIVFDHNEKMRFGNKFLTTLYKRTQMQSTFGINILGPG